MLHKPGNAALMSAAQYVRAQVLDLLLERGADVNGRNERGLTR
ncbi:hypothetical protein ACFL2Q_12260 [Thermodesulfobacteriota bacterium]